MSIACLINVLKFKTTVDSVDVENIDLRFKPSHDENVEKSGIHQSENLPQNDPASDDHVNVTNNL